MLSKRASSVAVTAGSLLAALQLPAQAVDSVTLELARGNQTDVFRAGAQWDWPSKWWQSNGTHIGGYWELSLAQWHGRRFQNKPDSTQDLFALGMTPVLRWQRDDKRGWYGELGIGAHYLTGLYDNNGRRESTRFQFGDHIGLGYVFADGWELRLRLQHFSNGGMREPNAGVNFWGVGVGRRF